MNTEQSLEYLKKREQELKTLSETYEKERRSILLPVIENRVKENRKKLETLKQQYSITKNILESQIQEDEDILYTETCSRCLHVVPKRLTWLCEADGGHYLCDRHTQKRCGCDDLRCESHPCTMHERRRPPSPY